MGSWNISLENTQKSTRNVVVREPMQGPWDRSRDSCCNIPSNAAAYLHTEQYCLMGHVLPCWE